MKALIDGDILRYEIGYAAETGWQQEDTHPPFDYVAHLFDERVSNILAITKADCYTLYLTGKNNFRNEIAKTKVYKGTRKDVKPFHFDNLTAYIEGLKPCVKTDGIEADDAMCIEQVLGINRWEAEWGTDNWSPNETIICSRDKDLRQCPGWHFSWEIGNQPQHGPVLVDKMGWLEMDREKKPPKLFGYGLKFFYSQLLTGDAVDNVPGLPGWGPVAAYEVLHDRDTPESLLAAAITAYTSVYANDWQDQMTEQGRLLWLVRRLNKDGSPVMWNIGDSE